MRMLSCILSVLLLGSCHSNNFQPGVLTADTALRITAAQVESKEIQQPDTTIPFKKDLAIDTKNTDRNELLQYAKQLIGIRYKYASVDPAQGFDCSGFITYVFNHFDIAVPRSSVDFTNAGTEVPVTKAKQGDLILFTGTDSTIRIVGHMGIVTENIDTLKFIHATSGKADGVTITALNNYYKGRFVKVISIFKNM